MSFKATNSGRLRDLGPREFLDAYDCERITANIVKGRFQYVLEHTCSSLMTNAFSPILRDYHDFSATLSGPPELDYANFAVAKALPVFWGAMRDGVANAVEEFGPDKLSEGDILVCNDPFRMGTHVNDMCFIRPLIRSKRLFGFVTIRAHMIDIGGSVAGGMSGTKRTVYENGLVIPPMLLFHADELVKPTLSLILDNSRFGELLLPDFLTIQKALLIGETLMLDIIDRYGPDAYQGCIRYTCDSSAETVREALEQLPDGTFEAEDKLDCDAIDDQIEYRISCKVVKVGGHCEIDFSDTSAQARTSINAAWPDVKTAVGVALTYLLSPNSAFTSAVMRDIDIVVPSGTVLSAEPPAAVFLYWEAMLCAVSCLFRIFNTLLGEDAVAGDCGGSTLHLANGFRGDGSPWMDFASASGDKGGWGGTRVGDGDGGQIAYTNNMLEPATESIEIANPVMIMRKEYRPDSGGAGRHRGGPGIIKDSLWLTAGEHYTSSVRQKTPSGFGTYGGEDGDLGGVWVWPGDGMDSRRPLPDLSDVAYADSVPVTGLLDPKTLMPSVDGVYFYWGRQPVWAWPENTVYRYASGGAGGWGIPFERDPDLVLRDVRDGYVTASGAERVYAVAIVGDPEEDPEGLMIDERRTAHLRRQR